MGKIEKDIEKLREDLKKLMDKEEHGNKAKVLKLSRELDELIYSFMVEKRDV